ncbi:MAG: ATP-binding protein [Thermodesulfobacteriota bacterium]
MKFGIRHKIFAVIMGLSLLLGGLFVVSSLVKLRTSMKKMDVFRQHEALVIGRFLDTFFDREEGFSSDPYAQRLIDQIMATGDDIKRLSIHAKAPEGNSPSGYWFLASTKREKIGLPSDPEDLEAMQSGQDIYLVEASSEKETEGEHTLDLTSSLRDLDHNIIGVAGITLFYKVDAGEKPEAQFEHNKGRAKAIANSLNAAIISERMLSNKSYAQRRIDEIVQEAPYISRLSIHAKAPKGKSPSGYWFLASTAPERIGQPSDLEDVESIKEDRHKILFKEDDAGNRFLNVTYPLHDVEGRAIATAGITIDLGAEDNFLAIAREEDINEMFMFLLGILGAGILFSLLFSAYFSRMITGPVKEYVEAAKDIAQGNLERKVIVDSQDEIGEFAGVFNHMAMSLKKTHEDLEYRAEQRARELFASEERFKALFDAAGDSIFILEVQENQKSVIVEVNKAACDLYGYNKEEMVGMMASEISDPAEKEEVKEKRLGKLLAAGKVSFTANNRKKDGAIFPIEVSARSVEIDDKCFVLAIGRDLTEKMMLEEQIRHSQKMKAVGTLTGGIAHEFNNIMMGVMGFGEMLQLQLEEGSTARRYADRIVTSAGRAAKLTAGLLAYSRKGTVRMKTMEVNDAVEDVRGLLDNMIEKKIELAINKSDEVMMINADKAQLEQVLVNLSSNAVWAMPEGGILTIKMGITEFDKPYSKRRLKINPGKYAHISVGDTGQGMSREVQEKIFEPFFTTKNVGDGTGLGLAMVYGTIRRHDGHIGVESKPGEGTVFDIYLPLAEGSGEKKQEEVPAPAKRGHETVLVAEDNETVRELIREILGDAGYKVLVAADGEEAVEIFSDNQDDIQFLLFDIGMPNKSGKEALDEIKKMAPAVKVVFISGYDDDNAHLVAIGEEGYTAIQKPLKTTALLQTIRDELDKPV